ncbi:MAG: tRNA lysidine(34) synthetase TilS [Acidobacteriota bacterium]|nr:tRNA lysidine(34) synthetase TilS [Acidobacteriota bacterium]
MEWERLKLPKTEDRVVLGVSGGADSTALLLAFSELAKAGRIESKIIVAHFDHGLRGAAGADDARWVASLAQNLGRDFTLGRASTAECETARRDNLEQAARRARYEFLAGTARKFGARAVLTAHTLDDQAETVLLRLLRGSGAEGLGGMRPVRPLDAGGDVLLIRPLLNWARRAETEEFCRERGVESRVDEMNMDERFARVRVRRALLPLLETFNPRVVEILARTADLLREDAAALESEAAELLRGACGGDKEEGTASIPSLRVEVLAGASVAVRRRAIRQWINRARGSLRRIELVHVAAVEKLLAGERGGRIAELPGGAFVERRRGWLSFYNKKVEKE